MARDAAQSDSPARRVTGRSAKKWERNWCSEIEEAADLPFLGVQQTGAAPSAAVCEEVADNIEGSPESGYRRTMRLHSSTTTDKLSI